MANESTDVLKQLLERLDKMDCHQQKLDRVMERLDTLHNVIEKQNKKQNVLDEQLVAVTIKLQQDKSDMREQLQEALQEIVDPIRTKNIQEGCTPVTHKTTHTLQSLGTQIGVVLNAIGNRTVDTADKCLKLTSWSRKMEDKLTELADKSMEMKTSIVEMSVMATKMCDKQMQAILDLDRKIEPINSSVLDVSRDVKIFLDTILTTNKQSVADMENRMSKSIDQISQSCKEQPLLINEAFQSDLNKLCVTMQEELLTNSKTVVTASETQASRINCAVEMLKEDLKLLIQTEGDNTSKYRAELGNIHSSINSLLESIQGNTETVLEKVDCTEASMISIHTTVISQMKELSTHTQVNKQLETLTSDLKDYLCMTKHEIFAVTEKEAQIVRDRIQGPLPCIGNYTFDFYVNNFKSLVRSGKVVYSLPWHINELQTCVSGYITLSTNGQMEVALLLGRHPREVGLQPRSGKTLKIKATICDINNKKLPALDVGENSWAPNEADITWNGDTGWPIGATSCDTLLEKGYGEQEWYKQGALLIRYDVTVQ